MPSWITAFVSQHPNMHRSATRGEIGLQRPISRGLLPLCRGAECARVSKCACLCLHLCEFKRDRKTHICLYVRSWTCTPLSALPPWFISKPTAHSSPLALRPVFHLFPSLSLSCSPAIHPSSKHLPSLRPTFSGSHFYPSIYINSSLHLHPLPAGRTISWIPAEWKDFRFNPSSIYVMCSGFKGRSGEFKGGGGTWGSRKCGHHFRMNRWVDRKHNPVDRGDHRCFIFLETTHSFIPNIFHQTAEFKAGP